jgi:peptidoglycan/xylan/chitin deacetylase (PgdA/CDA1 family)
VSVTFDNLGEAAEQELGMDTPTGGHYSVTTALPIVLGELADSGTTATFFVEGINAETYPDALRSIDAAGHEVAFHAWHHEEWDKLSDAEERSNLSRGLAAMRSLGLRPTGFRPPGGLLGEHTLERLQAEGLTYCSPAGSGAGTQNTVLLPFAWTNVDVYHVLPAFEALRVHIEGSPEPGGADRVAQTLITAVDEAVSVGAHVTLVLHTWVIEAERDAVRAVLSHVRSAAERGDAWVARCEDVAQWMIEHPDSFTDAPTLDTTSWINPS